jgi:poly(3-hydroxybutyrate) depolymerase
VFVYDPTKESLTRDQAPITFCSEYFAVMDLPAEFYLETVKLIFQDHALPLGKLEVHGRPVTFLRDAANLSRTIASL